MKKGKGYGEDYTDVIIRYLIKDVIENHPRCKAKKGLRAYGKKK